MDYSNRTPDHRSPESHGAMVQLASSPPATISPNGVLNLGLLLGMAEPFLFGLLACTPPGRIGMLFTCLALVLITNLVALRWPELRLHRGVLVIGILGLVPVVPLIVLLMASRFLERLRIPMPQSEGLQLDFFGAVVITLAMGVIYLLAAFVVTGLANAPAAFADWTGPSSET